MRKRTGGGHVVATFASKSIAHLGKETVLPPSSSQPASQVCHVLQRRPGAPLLLYMPPLLSFSPNLSWGPMVTPFPDLFHPFLSLLGALFPISAPYQPPVSLAWHCVLLPPPSALPILLKMSREEEQGCALDITVLGNSHE